MNKLIVYSKKLSPKVKHSCDLKIFDSNSEFLNINRPADEEKVVIDN